MTSTDALRIGLLLLAAAIAAPAHGADHVTYRPVPDTDQFPDATTPGAIQWACADEAATLRAHFATTRRPFDAALVHERDGATCHVDYTPTVTGFRADADDLPPSEIYVNVDSLALVARRTTQFGDALDISARLIEEIERPLSFVLSTERRLSSQWYTLGTSQQYGNRASLISWRSTSAPDVRNPWTQDYLKSGVARRRARVLVPRQLFEGRAADGAAFAPLLDSFAQDEGFVRSRLSWEGGDLQFVRHPRDPRTLILVHGQSARAYWGAALSDDEFAYVLRREFGADLSVDVSGIVPHADYFVAFLPADGVALVSEPVTDDRDIALAAAHLLASHFVDDTPATVTALVLALARDEPLRRRRADIRTLVDAARRDADTGWPAAGLADLHARIQVYVHNHCRADAAACFNDTGVDRMLRDDPELFRDWITESRRTRSDEVFTARLLDIIESQVVPVSRALTDRMDAKVDELETLGFTVVRVPRFGSDQNGSTRWAGISYANSLLLDRVLFVPTFGLGAVEVAMLDALGRALPAGYRVVPTYARHMLLHNGGVHCTVAIVRRPHDADTLWLRSTNDDD